MRRRRGPVEPDRSLAPRTARRPQRARSKVKVAHSERQSPRTGGSARTMWVRPSWVSKMLNALKETSCQRVSPEYTTEIRDVPSRATFVVGPDRAVRFAWAAQGPQEQPDLEALKEAVDQ